MKKFSLSKPQSIGGSGLLEELPFPLAVGLVIRVSECLVNCGMAEVPCYLTWEKPNSVRLVLEYRNVLENVKIKKGN